MDCSTPGLPVHHQLPEFTQTHVHWVSDGIQPSHPLLSPSPTAFSLSQHQGLFQMSKLLVVANGILVPWSRTEPRPTALGAWSLSHWTTREVPVVFLTSKRVDCLPSFLQEKKRKGSLSALQISLGVWSACVLTVSPVQLFATPWTVAYQARILEWVAISSSRGSSQPRDHTCIS